MFSKKISHPLFQDLNRGLFEYNGTLNIAQYTGVEVNINRRSDAALTFAVAAIESLSENLTQYLEYATEEAFEGYEIMKDLVESGELDIEEEGGELPVINNPLEVWTYMILSSVLIEPKGQHQVRLGFTCPWDVEHDFGIYIENEEYQYCGISV